jgi:hypothetical protein
VSRLHWLRPRGGSPVAWSATAVFLTLLVVWSIITPGFRNADEPGHVDSVLRLAEGGGWPRPAAAHLSDHVLRAKTLSGFTPVDGQNGNWAGGTLLPGVRRQIPPSNARFYALFSTRTVTPPAQRLPFDQLTLTRRLDLSRYPDQMTQHPPLYYAVTAGVVLATGALRWPFDRTMALMRLVSVAMVALLPLIAFSSTRTLTGNRRLADLASLLPLAVPQLAAIGAGVTNDALVILLGGVAVLLLARILCGDRSWRSLLLLGLTLGLAMLTKSTLLEVVPIAGLVIVVGARRPSLGAPLGWRTTLGRLAAVWGLAFVIGGWWWALNLVRYGILQPQGLPGATNPASGIGVHKDSALVYLGHWCQLLATSFWGRFGWLELPLNGAVVAVLSAVLALLVLLAFRRRGTRFPLLVLLSPFVLAGALLFNTTYYAHRVTGDYGGIQGRYLFGVLVPVFAAAAIGVGALVPEGGRLQRWLPAVAAPLVLAVAAYGLAVAFVGFYLDYTWTPWAAFHRMTDWSPWPAWGAEGAIVLLVGLSVVTLVLAVWSATSGRHDDRPESAQPTPLDGAAIPAT